MEGYRNISGIDLSKEQLEIAKRMSVEEIEEANLFEYLSKHPEEYEMITANDIIEYLPKDEVLKFLDTICRALQPGGRVLIRTVNASSLFGAATAYADFAHEQGFTPVSLAQVLRVCGFENIAIHRDASLAHDFMSLLRVCLWKITKLFLKSYLTIEAGTGRGLWKQAVILEPRMTAIGRKPSFKKSL